MDFNKRIQPPNPKMVRDILAKPPEKESTESFLISIVTPMFGGGEQAGKVNKERPVRESSIRGHLRFWWRATRGAFFKTVGELREREVQIFGDTSIPSNTKIRVNYVKDARYGNATNLNEQKKQVISKEWSSYALFPYSQMNGMNMLASCTFELNVQTSDQKMIKDELYPALWAWINFGGIGSRTRRGCGSLYCENFSPKLFPQYKTYEEWYKGEVARFNIDMVPSDNKREWATLPSDICVQQNEGNIIVLWRNAIEQLKSFRTYKANGKRSVWPEADALRDITGMREARHDTHPKDKGTNIAFPRAAMGLPINFQFKQDRELSRSHSDKREPYTIQLRPGGKNRLSSPLIIKSLATSETMGVGIIFQLIHPDLEALDIVVSEEWTKQNDKQLNIVKERIKKYTLTREHIYKELNYSKNPYKKINTTSAIEAFLQSEEVKQWKSETHSQKTTQSRTRTNKYPSKK
ncbi:type III-B CRISPR module RAMP protein Cmr1 [Paenibacillus sp. FSL H8-0537]|uniref:type III-B CRISPR module RAMP protein Cmr1 n=1 Tax=Paenibacillus sp. FSL H8-0537 TaxID=2921399 RepID=UPI003100DBB0